MGASSLNVLVWNKLAQEGTAANSKWYLAGNTMQALICHECWAVEFAQATPAQMGGDDFDRDVLFKTRGGCKIGFGAIDDKFVIQNKYN